MATGLEAAERYAEATGRPLVTVLNAGKVGKQADPPQYARSGKGGGKSAKHVEPSHLTFLLLADTIADPITSAPRVVPQYRALVPVTDIQPRTTIASALFGGIVAGGGTLGGLVDWLIDGFASPSGEGLRAMLSAPAVHFRFDLLIGYPSAGFRWDEGGKTLGIAFGLPQGALLLPPEPEARVVRRATVPFKLFNVLADLWRDTQDHMRRQAAAISAPARADFFAAASLAPGSAGEASVTPDSTKAAGTGIHNGLLSSGLAARLPDPPLDKAKGNLSLTERATAGSRDLSSPPERSTRDPSRR